MVPMVMMAGIMPRIPQWIPPPETPRTPWIPRIIPQTPRIWFMMLKGFFFLPQVEFRDEEIGIAILDLPQ